MSTWNNRTYFSIEKQFSRRDAETQRRREQQKHINIYMHIDINKPLQNIGLFFLNAFFL